RWLVKLKPLKPGGPFKMTVSGDGVVELNDLLVGEVWVCSGQSNMEMHIIATTNAAAVVAAAKDPLLRLCTVRHARGDLPQTEVPLSWHESGPVANSFSATAYFFGRDLRKALNVPVGLIHASVGATAIAWWMNRQAFGIVPKFEAPLRA